MARELRRLCLINPRRDAWSFSERIRHALLECHKYLKAWYSPSLSLLTIAGLTPPSIAVDLVNEDFESVAYDQDYDLVGITAMTQTAPRAYEIADHFRSRGIYVVIGGIHPTVLPDEAALHADTTIVGEAEETWPRFLEDFRNSQPQRKYMSPVGHRVDLAASPIPRYELLTGRECFMDPHYYYNFVPVQASRGCPHDCDFCLVSQIYGKKPRLKGIDQVRKEILAIKKHLPNRLILFADDNLFIDRRYARHLLACLTELQVRWIAQCDISIGSDDELLRMIYRAGCLFLLIGFESLDAVNLTGLNRNNWKMRQLPNYQEYVQNIHSHGIMVFGSFIFGLDHDDSGVFARVVDFMNRNQVTGQLTLATPLPGSRLFNRLKREGRFLYPEPFWERCTFLDVLFRLKRMSKQEAEDGFIWAYRQLFNEKAFAERAAFFKEIYKRLD
jgi:radical SAM superfamily enzyme YgiQ (UPF0313 family)